MDTVKARDVQKGDVLKLFFGTHAVIDIKRYIGKLDFILNTLVFDNGNEMSNENDAIYEAVYLSPRIKNKDNDDSDLTDWENRVYMRGCRGIDY